MEDRESRESRESREARVRARRPQPRMGNAPGVGHEEERLRVRGREPVARAWVLEIKTLARSRMWFLTNVSVSVFRLVAGAASGFAVARIVPASASRSLSARFNRCCRLATRLLYRAYRICAASASTTMNAESRPMIRPRVSTISSRRYQVTRPRA